MVEVFEKVRKIAEILETFTDTDWETLNLLINNVKISESSIDLRGAQRLSCKDKKIKVTELVKSLGITGGKGYDYLIEAVLFVMKDPLEYRGNFTKLLYPQVAEKFATTPSSVEKAMRHTIINSWYKCDMQTKNKIFGECAYKPKNSEIVISLAEYVNLYLI